MATVISSRSPSSLTVAALARRIERVATAPVFLLVLHTDDFAHAAWREGRRAAQLLERNATGEFADIAGEVLLDQDAIVDSATSGVFAVAIFDSAHSASDASDEDGRRSRARGERALIEGMGVELTSSWVAVRPGDDPARAMESALECGRRRRERRVYAELLHDMTTIVSAIRGSLAAALDERVDEGTGRRFLGSAFAESGRLGRLLHGFLSAEQREDSMGSTDLAVALGRAVGFVEPLAIERGMTVRVCSRSARSCISAELDEDKAMLLLVGLLDNAIKYGRAGGTIEASTRFSGSTCEIVVEDDGPGIPEADRARIFEFGQRADGHVPGWGIGLARARSLLEEHGGEICVERSSTGGARFIVRLPRETQKPVQH